MSEPGSDALEQLLRRTLDATARAAVGEHRRPPSFAPDEVGLVGGLAEPVRRRSWLAPVAAAAAVAAVAVAGLVGLGFAGRGGGPAGTSAAAPGTHLVHVSSPIADGDTVGVGMPVVLRFSALPASIGEFDRAVNVRVNGKDAGGAWLWRMADGPGYTVEAQYRAQRFWPSHASITLSAPLRGRSAGPGMRFDNDFSLHYATGAAQVSVVDDQRHTLTVRRDGKVVHTCPVTLGKPGTPTLQGIKVIQQKEQTHLMTAPEYAVTVRDALRLTNSGEFVFAAPWAQADIGRRNVSGGGTGLKAADAAWLFRNSRVGDVIEYPDASGPPVTSYDGFGGWNLNWYQWTTGGLFH